jgi:hypothetical protein
MGKHILRKRLKKLFLFICIAAIVLSNFVSVIPVKAIQIDKPADDTVSTVSEQAPQTTAEQEIEKESDQSQQEDTSGSKVVNGEEDQAVKEEQQQPETEGIVQEDAQVDDKEQQEY